MINDADLKFMAPPYRGSRMFEKNKDMEKSPVIKFGTNFTYTIWLCQSVTGSPYECRKQPTVIIFAHRYFLECLISTVLLEIC